MIEEQFVSFDTAKMLKEAGFDVPCNSQYMHNGFRWNAGSSTKVNFNEYRTVFSCPTLALAARWLREVHHYAVCVWYSADYEKWFYAHGDMNNMAFDVEYNISEFIFDSYEQALEAGLQEAIKLIKK